MSDISHKVIKPERSLIDDSRYVYKTIIAILFKNYSLFREKSEVLINSISKIDTGEIHEELQIPSSTINYILSKFLYELKVFKDFLNNCKVKWYTTDPKKTIRHVKIYLHKIHRLAPVFNYKRARENLTSLHKLSCSDMISLPFIYSNSIVSYLKLEEINYPILE